MNLQQFLSAAQGVDFWSQQPVHYFVYQDEEHCPAAFFGAIRCAAEKHGGLPLQTVRVEQGLSGIYAQLQTSFLGSAWRYSLMCSALSDRDRRELFAYAVTYQGPHALMLFVARDQVQEFDKRELNNDAVVALDGQIDEIMCFSLATFLGYTLSLSAQRMVRRLFKETQRMPLASAMVILEYTLLAGATLPVADNAPLAFDPEQARHDLALEEMLLGQLRGMLKPESSLFTLSQLFFAKQSEPFYNYLATVQSIYPEQFWISFWSEQLYRAFFYVSYMKKGNQSEAQKIGTRLPFSFLQRDWRKHEPARLAAAHAQLYELDSALKNGRGELGFDRFYHNFFK